MTHVTCRLTAKNRDHLQNPIRSVVEYGLPFILLLYVKFLQPDKENHTLAR